MFCNTYHLLVHPGPEVVRGAGGLHKWMGHEGALITDSGGFQVFSLSEPNEEDGPEMKCKNKTRTAREGGGASLLSTSEHGAYFRSYHDGRTIELTPESSVAAQKALGADIIIPLDELPPYHISRERRHASVRLSPRWMARSLRAHRAVCAHCAVHAVHAVRAVHACKRRWACARAGGRAGAPARMCVLACACHHVCV